jgi:endonuclease/exonuclease/phosphatase family metal-dependent hydrolase
MELQFHAAMETTGEKYGNAILSRFPMTLRYAELLPSHHRRREPRGALWVSIDLGDRAVDVMTTHLGLSAVERLLQVDELFGPRWLGHPHRNPRCVLCGDFNSTPRSRVYRRLAGRFVDAHRAAGSRRPGGTWFSPFPLARLDHVFLDGGLSAGSANAAGTRLARVASDHLPVVVDVDLQTRSGESGHRPRRLPPLHVPTGHTSHWVEQP